MKTTLGILLTGLVFLYSAAPLAAHHAFDTEYKIPVPGCITG